MPVDHPATPTAPFCCPRTVTVIDPHSARESPISSSRDLRDPDSENFVIRSDDALVCRQCANKP